MGDAKLSKEARKFLRTFKKMFDAFAEKNQSVKAEKSEGSENAKRFAEDIGNYSEDEIKSIESRDENIVARPFDDVLIFYKESLKNEKNEGKTLFLGKISEKTAVR